MIAGAAAVALTPPEYAAPARRLALLGAACEVAASEAMEHGLGEHGEPYEQGVASKSSNVSRGLVVAGAALVATRGGRSRAVAVAGGALLSAGALAARWSVFKAGFQSASDPKYVVEPQRAAIEHGDRRGAARSQPRAPVGA